MTLPIRNIYHTNDQKGLEAVANSDVVFVSVGAGNLPQVGIYLKKALLERTQDQPLLVITAENAIGPAKKLAEAIEQKKTAIPDFS